jgi:hypothetical protein
MVLPIETGTFIIDVVEFSPSNSDVAESSLGFLDELSALMIERRWLVEVEGRVAARERPGLALERANAVIRALLERGVSARQLVAVDRGTEARREGPQSIVTFRVVELVGADARRRPVDAFDPTQNPRAKDAVPGP